MRRLLIVPVLGFLAITLSWIEDTEAPFRAGDAEAANGGRIENALSSRSRPTPSCERTDPHRCLDTVRSAVLPSSVRKDPKLSWPLAQLSEADETARAQGRQINAASLSLLPKSLRDLIKARLLRLDEAGNVQVFIKAKTSADSLVSTLEAGGSQIERVAVEHGIVQARVPVSQLRSVAVLPGVGRVDLPDYGVTQVGSRNSEGDALLSAAAARTAFGIDGTGVRVGVISDGVEGLAASQASSDLPAVDTTTCDVGPGTPTASGAGSEGTAMLEIVHDLAPGAELWFGYFGFTSGTLLDFMAAVNCLADNVDIVVDDIGWYNVGAYDGTSIVSQNVANALNDPANRIRGYYNAVGNDALRHYQEPYTDSGQNFTLPPDSWDLQRFAATGSTTDAGVGLPCACADTLVLAPGAMVIVELQWNDAFGASGNDYDVFLLSGDTVVGVGGDFQGGTGDPAEFIAYVNDSAGPQVLDLVIGNFNGMAAPRTFDMFVLCDDCAPLPDGDFGQPVHNFNTRCSSVSNNSDAGGGVIAVGAINADDPGTNDIAPYSSCGPTNDGRTKPQGAAIDGVSVTGNGGFASTFFGSSAAAPHAAAIAALLLDCNPSLTRTQLHDTLLNTADDVGPAGTDNIFGAGRLDALAAATAATCGADGLPTPTPTATSTPPASPTPAVTATDTPTGGETATPTRTATATRTATPTPRPAFGDANCDRSISSVDAALVLQYGASLISRLSCQQNADVNGDGRIDSIDAALILQFVAGLIDSLPASGAAGGREADAVGARFSRLW